MNLTPEQAHRLATMIKPSDVIKHINDHRSEYKEWLMKQLKINQITKEEYNYEIKIFKIKTKQSTND